MMIDEGDLKLKHNENALTRIGFEYEFMTE